MQMHLIEDPGIRHLPIVMILSQAALTIGGFQTNELQSLINNGQYRPALTPGHPFTNVQSTYYWSGSTDFYATEKAWIVSLDYGNIEIFAKKEFLYIWPVRGDHN